MQTQVSGEERCGIGARLRTARERSGLTSVQAAERLHLDPHVIAALETEKFESLGAPVYVRGHLKRYAELVGEPAGELQQHYAASVQPTALPDLTQIPKSPRAPHRGTLLAAGVAVLAAVALIGTVWWVIDALEDAAPLLTQSPVEPTRTLPDDAAETTPPAPVIAPTASAAQSAREVRAAPPKMAALTLRFSADSWVEVYDADGERLLFDIGSADTTRTLNGAAPLRVVLGNASGVALEVNGQPAVIPESAVRDDGHARFVVNRSGRIVRSRLAAGGTTP